MRIIGSSLLAVFVFVVLLTTAAQAVPIVFVADLSGSNEFPSNASPGTGTAKIIFDTTAHTMRVLITFADLSGTTTAAHIHCCVDPSDATPTAGVATMVPTFDGFPLGVTSGSYDFIYDLTDISSFNPSFVTAMGGTAAAAEAALLAGLLEGFAYLNIHTNLFPGGEIRGFLRAVPEPASLAEFALGLLGLSLLWCIASVRRRRVRLA